MIRKRWLMFLGTGISISLIISLFSNKKLYSNKAWYFVLGKSIADVSLVFLSAWKLPALLYAWIGAWLTKPIKNPAFKLVAGIIVGTVISFLAAAYMEIVIILGLLAVDMTTGKDGFLGYVEKYEAESVAKAA